MRGSPRYEYYTIGMRKELIRVPPSPDSDADLRTGLYRIDRFVRHYDTNQRALASFEEIGIERAGRLLDRHDSLNTKSQYCRALG
jgi:hypothetical protein